MANGDCNELVSIWSSGNDLNYLLVKTFKVSTNMIIYLKFAELIIKALALGKINIFHSILLHKPRISRDFITCSRTRDSPVEKRRVQFSFGPKDR